MLHSSKTENKLACFLMFLTLLHVSCGKPNYEIEDKMRRIELGMHKNEVVNILGEPRNIFEGELDGISYIVMYYEPPSRYSSATPNVKIRKDNELVVEVIINDLESKVDSLEFHDLYNN